MRNVADHLQRRIGETAGKLRQTGRQPEDEADGWSSAAPEIKAPQPMGDGSKAEPMPIVDPFTAMNNSLDPNVVQDLPF
jgi:hypothetical protein